MEKFKKTLEFITSISQLSVDYNFKETCKNIEQIVSDKLDCKAKVIEPEELRDYLLSYLKLGNKELKSIGEKIPFEKGEEVYIPFKSNGEKNLGLLYIKDSKFLKSLQKEERRKFLEMLSNNLGYILARAKKTDILREEAMYDKLTGLLKGAVFLDKWEEMKKEIVKNNASCSILMIDIDDFKKYNDLFGHPKGDYVLQKVGQTIKNNCRIGDIPVRYGGDEFLVYLANEAARIVAERIRNKIKKIPFTISNITISIGYSTFPSLSSIETIIEDADKALLEAKKIGKDKIVSYSKIEITKNLYKCF